MNTKYKLTIIALLISGGAFLQSCASSSGPVATGPDTYMISRSKKGFSGNSGSVKAAALEEANQYCISRGKVMKVISSAQKDMVPFHSDALAEIHFKCLDPNDPELKQPINTGSLSTRVFRGDEDIKTISVEIENKQVGSTSNDPYAELAKLGELKKNGVINDEEFETEKKKILSRIK